MEKTLYYERLLFEMVIVIVKDKKYSINDTISIKISFMHYMKWRRVMLPVVFEKFELFCSFVAVVFLFCFFVFCLSFYAISFHCQCQLVKKSTLANILGTWLPSISAGLVLKQILFFLICLLSKIIADPKC